jgi:hypothetical protein
VNTLIAFTAKHPLTLRGAPADAEWVYVGEDPHDYWRTLCSFWERGDDLTVIEHDIMCRPDVVEGFAACPKPWCLHKYSNHDAGDSEAWMNALGCTRFRKEIVLAVPDAVSNIEPQWRDWHNLCDGIGENLRAAQFRHHWHEGAVLHHVMSLEGLEIGG